MTAADLKRQKLIAKREEIAERKKAAILKAHEEQEYKIAALDAKLDKNLKQTTMTAAQIRV